MTSKTGLEFKVGDAVKYGGKKHTINSVHISNNAVMYHIKTSVLDYHYTVFGVRESELIAWKDTVLTHCLQSDGVTWSDGGPNGWKTEWYQKIEPLPNYTSPALFKVTTKSGNECIFRGIKGDDI